MSTSEKKINTVGGPPGSLKAWLFGLRLPANQHRILELMVEKADPEDGALWYREEWFSHWSGMSVRNVRRIVKTLERGGLLRVWPLPNRASVYQVQCPQLAKRDNLERVELLRAVKLGEPREVEDNLSGTPGGTDCPPEPDKTGPQAAPVPDKTGPQGDPNCPPEVPKGITPVTTDEDQGKVCAERWRAAAPAAGREPENWRAFKVTDPNHPYPIRPKDDGSPAVMLIPLTASGGRPFAVTADLVKHWTATYPAVDVVQKLREIADWNFRNERKRKTPKGILDHIGKWLANEQNKGGGGPYRPPAADPKGAAQTRTAQNVAAAQRMARGSEV